MKLPVYLLTLSFILLTVGCSTAENANENDIRPGLENVRPADAISDDRDYYRSLGDYLLRVPGVVLSGPENNYTVTIRGISSFNSGIEPLFVLDGQIIGTTYAQANNMINVRDINYVRVLKGADAGIYGVRGGNGVILIVTK